MRDIQSVTIYYHVVYTLAAILFGGYALGVAMAARKTRARLDAITRR